MAGSSVYHQDVTWTNVDLWSICRHFGTMWIKIHFHSWKCICHCHVPNFGEASMCSATNIIIVNQTPFFTATNDHCRHLGFELFSMTKRHVWLHVDVVHARWLTVVIMLIEDLHVVLSYRMPHLYIAILYYGKRGNMVWLVCISIFDFSGSKSCMCRIGWGKHNDIFAFFIMSWQMVTKGRGLFIWHSQYHGCKWPDNTRNQGISNHGIDLVAKGGLTEII